jgi:hypothetical protein
LDLRVKIPDRNQEIKIIFLDVDGPMIPGRCYYAGIPRKPPVGWTYDPLAVKMIRHLCDKYDAKIVYNSSHNDEGETYILDQAINNGMGSEHLHKNYMTEFPRETYSREVGIERWLRAHPEVTNYCCVDDFPLALPNAVKVEYSIGITLDNYEKMERLLNNG